MKKHFSFLALTCAFVAPLLVGCGGGNSNPTELEYLTSSATKAFAQFDGIYGELSSPGVSDDYTLYTEVTYEDMNFTISYVADNKAYTTNYLEVSKTGKIMKVVAPLATDVEESFLKCAMIGTIKFESYVATTGTGHEYTTKYVGTEMGTHTWNVRVNPVNVVTIEDIYEAADAGKGLTYTFFAYFQGAGEGNVLSSTKLLYVADGEYAMSLYGSDTVPTGISVGDQVKVTGILDIYNGLYEVKSYTMVKTSGQNISTPVDLTVTSLTTDGFKTNMLNRNTVLVGTFTTIDFTYGDDWQYGTVRALIHVVVPSLNNLEVNVFLHYSQSTEAQYNLFATNCAKNKQSTGLTLTCHGHLGIYSGAYQITTPVFDSIA